MAVSFHLELGCHFSLMSIQTIMWNNINLDSITVRWSIAECEVDNELNASSTWKLNYYETVEDIQ